MAYVGGILIEAGSDITSSTLLSFFLGTMQSKNALRQAQEEVDRCYGANRSLGAGNLGLLPYIEACMHKVGNKTALPADVLLLLTAHTQTRHFAGAPLLRQRSRICSHRQTRIRITCSLRVLSSSNTWAIHHDENEYSKPHKFNLDR